MAKVSFASLKLKTKDDVKTIMIGDKEVEVKQYLPTADKVSLIEIAIQVADGATILNTLALDALFHLYIVFKYTNLNFTDAQKEDLLKLYDVLETNGVIEEVLKAIPEEEYAVLHENLDAMLDGYDKYRNSTRAIVEQLSVFAPQAAVNLSEQLKDFDVTKMQEILAIAEATGANRPQIVK